MKSYTDIEQSKKLAEILPVESADGFYEAQHNPLTDKWEYILFTGNKWASEEVVIPCWSLAALIETMPEILIERVKAQDGYDGYYYFVTYEELIKVPYKKELIDACVEMILKLHEEKLL